MDCCAAEPAADGHCPQCGARGRSVGLVTLECLVANRSFPLDGWRFCRTLDCPVAYFHDSEAVVEVRAVKVEILQKSRHPNRPVCYCFDHDAEDILADSGGVIAADIKARCRRGEDRCSRTNPQGACCLGNVHELMRQGGQAP